MLKALWLTSWYPNKLNPMNGDFIQRHAHAASLFCDVHVIHLETDEKNMLEYYIETHTSISENLKEEIVLYKPRSGSSFFTKIISNLRYKKLFKEHVKNYIAKNGTPDIVHVHVPVKCGIIALWLKKKYGIKYIVTEHWAIYNDYAEDAYRKRNLIFKFYTKKILRNAAFFLPVSNELGMSVKKSVTPVNYKVVYNCVDTAIFNCRNAVSKNEAFTFIHVSTLKYQKNPEGILRCFKIFSDEFPQSKLLMVGEGYGHLEALAVSLNIGTEKIEFTGLKKYEEVAVLMQQSHALLMFSRFENMPCVIAEALCCGLPFISTDVGGIKEIADEKNALLVSSEDERSLLEAMRKMYLNYQSYQQNEIAADAEKKFSYQTIGKQIEEIYSGLNAGIR
jgi:glycosyltransferase involved in cell wall biosynthesis